MKTVSFVKKPSSLLHSATVLCLLGSISAAQAETPAGYYDSANATNPAALRSSLHEIIDDHQRFPYTSSATDTWDILEAADEDPDNANNIIDIYKNASYTKEGGGNSFYNREHTWPKSYGFPDDGSSNYPYTDTHHLFLSDSSYNSSRSNKPYADCNGCSEKITLLNNNRGGGAGESNWTAGSFEDGSWQTWAGRKGDTARAMMYMAIRYEGGTHSVTGVSEPDLILTDDRSLIGSSSTGNNMSVAYMGLKSMLLQWHKEDPVDAFEQRHNDTVYMFQGNRNPFVDHPEYAACVFENICNGGGGDTTAPSAPSGLSATGGDLQVNLSWSANSESDLAGYNIYRSTVSGSTGSKINTSLVTGTTLTDTTVDADTTYYYTVNAVDTSFNQSGSSFEAVATTDAGTTPPPPVESSVWINEFHYDNESTDSGEAVEVAGTAGTDLSGWTLVGYNGNGGTTYKTVTLSGVIADQDNGMGTLNFAMTGLQNGAPDGIALIDNNGVAVQFLSYEGSFAATNGPASGMTSTDVIVKETSSTPAGHSLQLSGSGSNYSDFAWQSPATSTFGAVNNGQSFSGGTPPPPPVNEAPTAVFTSSCYALGCTFDASSSEDTDGTIANYDWDFGDGNSSTEAKPTHAYDLEGEYNVTLTITDDAGATDSIAATVSVAPLGAQPWVNEFHYDNTSSDKNEGVEIAGEAGTDLKGWTIVAYNGRNGTTYKTISLSGVIADQEGGYGTLNFAVSGLQNGAPDGFALVDNGGHVVQFLSYEGTFDATNGIASGMTSTDVGVRETSSTPVGHSLQLGGEGTQYSDFTWQSVSASTAGASNNNQTLGEPNLPPVASFTPSCKGLNCTFDASASTDAEGVISSYEWNFGNDDTTLVTGTTAAYSFSDIGEYTVTLTVTDELGATAQATMVVTIVEQRHFENATTMDIEDHGTISSDLVVDRTIDTNSVDINVDITHEHRGNIKMTLVAPDGSEYVLKKHKRKDNEQDINATYSVDFTGSPVGTWTLIIKDQYWNEVGQLNSWSVQF